MDSLLYGFLPAENDQWHYDTETRARGIHFIVGTENSTLNLVILYGQEATGKLTIAKSLVTQRQNTLRLWYTARRMPWRAAWVTRIARIYER